MTAARRALRSPAFLLGTGVLAVILGGALLAPVLAPYPPGAQDLTGGLLPPSPEHWFGTDQLGRDVLSRMLYAARTDLRIAFLAAITPFVVGVTVGLVSGASGGVVDWVLSRVTDTVIAFPFTVIVIALVFALGAGEGGIIAAFALVGWVGYARVLRAMTASLRDAGWVQAARGGGLSPLRVLLRHLLPNVLPQAIVLLTTEIVLIMVAIVTLGYLGLGIQPPTPDWGTMIADAQPFITTQWWLAAIPGLAVVVTGVSLSLLGDGIGDVLRVGELDGGARGASRAPALERSPAADPAVMRGGVRVRGLRIADRAGRVLVDGIDLDAAPGAALGIVGESGSGKSLTLRALLGMLPAGTVRLGRASGDAVEVGGPVGMVFQDPLTALDPLSRVGTQVREAVRASGADAGRQRTASRVRELLRLVRLPDPERVARSYPHELSGGQRQRVVIAMALAGDPAVLLCDEPTTSLDVTVQREVLELLAELRRSRGLTLVFVSHDLAVVAAVCERMVVMREGRVVERGATERVIRDPARPYTRALLEAVPTLPELEPLPRSGAGADPARPVPAGPSGPSDPAGLSGRSGLSGPSSPEPPLLEVRGASVRYGRDTGVADISLAVPRGGALGIVGESGSGKTTLARAIAGQLPLSAGGILLDGQLLGVRRGPAARREIQLVPQDPASSLDPRMTVAQTLGELLRAVARDSRPRAARSGVPERVAELLELVRLDRSAAAAYPHELSGGQRQRVAIARALAVEPRVLVADEPTSALDVEVQRAIVELLLGLRRDAGITLVFVSHDLAVVHELCEAVLVMRDGRAVEHGGAEFFTRPREAYSRRLLSAVPRIR